MCFERGIVLDDVEEVVEASSKDEAISLLRSESFTKIEDASTLKAGGRVDANFAKRIKLTAYYVEGFIGKGICEVVEQGEVV